MHAFFTLLTTNIATILSATCSVENGHKEKFIRMQNSNKLHARTKMSVLSRYFLGMKRRRKKVNEDDNCASNVHHLQGTCIA